jgi:hypothetical protein
VANCPNDAGTSVSSGVYLPSHVTNTEGKLEVCQFNCSYADDVQDSQIARISCSCLLVENGVCSEQIRYPLLLR